MDAAAPPGPLDGVVAAVRQAAAARGTTDVMMGKGWLALAAAAQPLALLFVVVTGALGTFTNQVPTVAFLTFIVVAITLPGVVCAAVFWKLLARMSNHFAREAHLRRAVTDYLRGRAALEGREALVAGDLATLESINSEAALKDQPQPAALSALALIPFAKWVVLFVLTRWPADHDERWEAFCKSAAAAAEKLGRPLGAFELAQVRERSFTVYLILQVVTAGLFGIYWYWMLIEDGNRHFRTHASVEAALAAALG